MSAIPGIPEVPNLRQTTDFWDVSKRSLIAQRQGRYMPDHKDDPEDLKAGRTWPDVAGAIIDTYSEPGQMVYDPMCGVGTTLVEAVWRDRQAAGTELEFKRADRAIANLKLAERLGLRRDWSVTVEDVRESPGILPHANLIVIDPPFGATRQDGGKHRFGAALANYSGEDRIKSRAQRDQRNVGNLKFGEYLSAMQEVYRHCLLTAAPGATLAVILKDYRKDFTRVDLLGHTRHIVEAAGWRYYDRAVLYLGRASDTQRRNAAANNNLLQLTQDLLVFKAR